MFGSCGCRDSPAQRGLRDQSRANLHSRHSHTGYTAGNAVLANANPRTDTVCDYGAGAANSNSRANTFAQRGRGGY